MNILPDAEKAGGIWRSCGNEVQQWVSGVRCHLERILLTKEASLEYLFFELLKDLEGHNFISKQQAKYLWELKAIIAKDKVIVLMDFPEHYHIILQDAPQSLSLCEQTGYSASNSHLYSEILI